MAQYARFYSSTWKSDFTALSHGAQWLYMALISQPDISNCGVLALTRGRWAILASDTDADSVQAFLDELIADDKVIVDHRTEEVWVRSYMRYDALATTNQNGYKSVQRAVAEVLSTSLREQLNNELGTVVGTRWSTVPEPVDPTGGRPQQPAASSQQPSPSPTPAAAAVSDLGLDTQPAGGMSAAAIEAIDIAIEHEVLNSSKPIRSYSRFADTVRARLLREHGATLRACESGEARWIAHNVLGLSTSDVIFANVKLRERTAS